MSLRASSAAPSTIRGVSAALAAGGAVVALWVGLSYAFDLTFHFHPVFVGVAAGWGYRRGDAEGPNRVGILSVAAGSAALVVAGAGAIAVGGRGLDAGWFIALVAAVGLVGGLKISWRRRGATSDDSRQRS